jgi:hypothetical protein
MTLHNVLGFVGLGAVLVLIFLLLVSVVIVLGHGMWYALYRSSGPAWLQIVLFATASTFVIPATALALCLANVFDGKDPQPALAKLLPVLPACAILGPYILVFVVNLIWRTFYGPPGRSWQRTLYVDSAWCLGVSLVSFALAFAIGGDFWSGLTNFCISLLVIGCNLIPLDLIISAPANVSLVRSAREWDALSLE